MKKIGRYISFITLSSLLLFNLTSCENGISPDPPLPDTYGKTIFVGSDNKIVYAIDPDKGIRKWEFQVDGPIAASPVLAGGALWVATTSGTLYKLGLLKGELMDSLELHMPMYGTPMAYKDRLIIAAGNELRSYLFGYLDTPQWVYNTGGTLKSSPAINYNSARGTDVIYIGTYSTNRFLAVDFHTGLRIWEILGTEAGGFESSATAVDDTVVYVGGNGGRVYSINSNTGVIKWKFITGGPVKSSPISVGGNIIVGSSDRNLYSIDNITGAKRWSYTTGDQVVSSPVVDNQFVYFGSYDKKFYALDIINGKLKWSRETFGLVKSSPVISNGVIYFGSFDRNLYALDTASGGNKWMYNMHGQMQSSAIVDQIDYTDFSGIHGNYKY